jgi:hypothetical protein
MTDNSQFHPKEEHYGEVHRTDTKHGTSANGRAWHLFEVTFVTRKEGKWDKETRTTSVFETYKKATIFGTDEEVAKLARALVARDKDNGIRGSEILIRGWAGANTFPDKETGLKKTSSTILVEKPEFDWQYFYQNNTESQDVQAPVAAPVARPAAPAAPVMPVAPIADDDDLFS